MAQRRRIVIDRDVCIGSGNCTFYASKTFDVDADDKSTVIDPLGDDAETQRMAVDNCPTGALSFADDAPGPQAA